MNEELNSLEEIKAKILELPSNTKALLLMERHKVFKKGIDGEETLKEFLPKNIQVVLCHDVDSVKLLELGK